MNSIYKLLYEQPDVVIDNENLIITTPPNELSATRLSKDSVDDQIDSFIMDFEERSIVKNDDNQQEQQPEKVVTMSESLHDLNLKYLFEQEEEEGLDVEEEFEDPGADVDVEGEVETDEPDPAGSEEMGDVESVKIPTPKIDMDKFAQSIVRLTKNYQSLLDVKTAIVNRAKNYLLENYGEKHVNMYVEILNTDFNFDIKKFDIEELEDDDFSGDAGGLGAGQSGGGGGA